ncbi:hypothetical protein CDL15_Pgr026489 [Punica granatum]|uniref:Uncharacterized protein n=1 Tax=Punica granatum TaxID=22663 RepID=A0A218WM02_PUNGR|nr:hypothetical protein CDL15_Pgr026489 [Punica granatum]
MLIQGDMVIKLIGNLEHQPERNGGEGCEEGRDECRGIRGWAWGGGGALGSGLLDGCECRESHHQCNKEVHLHRLHCFESKNCLVMTRTHEFSFLCSKTKWP